MSSTIFELTRAGVIMLVVAGVVACNNSDYKTADNTPGADSGTRRVSTTTMRSDSTGVAASPAPAVEPSVTPNEARTPGSGKASSASQPVAKAKFSHGHASISAPKIYSNAGIAPAFPGGQHGLDAYINNHVNYPQQAIDDEVSGVVHISFIVDEDGRVTRAKVMQPSKVGDGLDQEVLRVINSMPAWTPGKVHGKKVA